VLVEIEILKWSWVKNSHESSLTLSGRLSFSTLCHYFTLVRWMVCSSLALRGPSRHARMVEWNNSFLHLPWENVGWCSYSWCGNKMDKLHSVLSVLYPIWLLQVVINVHRVIVGAYYEESSYHPSRMNNKTVFIDVYAHLHVTCFPHLKPSGSV
jgi:hypothetical protein